MDRREFMGRSGCHAAFWMAMPALSDLAAQDQAPAEPKYKVEIEIYEARQDTWCHKKGDKFEYPKDISRICPWLLSSMHDFIVLLQHGATLPWKYEGTPYQKVIDAAGVTTEYVRCPDPTSNLVAKIIRTRLA
jgi:uncharacterized repeat protein (TIGR04076 family)